MAIFVRNCYSCQKPLLFDQDGYCKVPKILLLYYQFSNKDKGVHYENKRYYYF